MNYQSPDKREFALKVQATILDILAEAPEPMTGKQIVNKLESIFVKELDSTWFVSIPGRRISPLSNLAAIERDRLIGMGKVCKIGSYKAVRYILAPIQEAAISPTVEPPQQEMSREDLIEIIQAGLDPVCDRLDKLNSSIERLLAIWEGK